MMNPINVCYLCGMTSARRAVETTQLAVLDHIFAATRTNTVSTTRAFVIRRTCYQHRALYRAGQPVAHSRYVSLQRCAAMMVWSLGVCAV